MYRYRKLWCLEVIAKYKPVHPAARHIAPTGRFCVITAGSVLIVSDVAGDEALRQHIRPGKGKYPLPGGIASVPCQAGVVLIAGTYIILRGVRFVHEEYAFVIRPVIEPLIVNVTACGGVAVSNFHAKARVIQVEVNGFEKRALLAVAFGVPTVEAANSTIINNISLLTTFSP